MKYELEIKARINDQKAIIIGRTVILFGMPRVAVGLWGESIAFACERPRTLDEARLLIYTPSELDEFLREGKLEGAAEL